jgi:hypothetical protein
MTVIAMTGEGLSAHQTVITRGGSIVEIVRLLLEANPLDDVDNLTKQVGVMVRGKWFAQANLQQRLARAGAVRIRKRRE